MVRRRGGRWAVIHGHGRKKGQVIAYHRTKKAATAQHRAIEASKSRRRECEKLFKTPKKVRECIRRKRRQVR